MGVFISYTVNKHSIHPQSVAIRIPKYFNADYFTKWSANKGERMILELVFIVTYLERRNTQNPLISYVTIK